MRLRSHKRQLSRRRMKINQASVVMAEGGNIIQVTIIVEIAQSPVIGIGTRHFADGQEFGAEKTERMDKSLVRPVFPQCHKDTDMRAGDPWIFSDTG